MKTTKEMIEVMQHFENGGEVEFSDDNFETVLGESKKEDEEDLCWNWDEFDYRIKEPKQKVTIEKWLCLDSKQEEFVIYETSNVDKNRELEKIKFIGSYEIEL